MTRLHSHSDAMALIFGALSVTTLSYEEAIAIYLRARGILDDGNEMMGAAVPWHWVPGRISADAIAVILEDALYVEGGRIEGQGLAAVKIAEAAERGELKFLRLGSATPVSDTGGEK